MLRKILAIFLSFALAWAPLSEAAMFSASKMRAAASSSHVGTYPQDFTTYTITTGITIDSSTGMHATETRVNNYYSYKNLGSGFTDGYKMILKFDFKITAITNPGGLGTFTGMGDVGAASWGTFGSPLESNGFMAFGGQTSGGYLMEIDDIHAGTNTTSYGTYVYALSTQYYGTLTYDPSVGTYGTIYLATYSDSGRTASLESFSQAALAAKTGVNNIHGLTYYNSNTASKTAATYLNNLSLELQ